MRGLLALSFSIDDYHNVNIARQKRRRQTLFSEKLFDTAAQFQRFPVLWHPIPRHPASILTAIVNAVINQEVIRISFQHSGKKIQPYHEPLNFSAFIPCDIVRTFSVYICTPLKIIDHFSENIDHTVAVYTSPLRLFSSGIYFHILILIFRLSKYRNWGTIELFYHERVIRWVSGFFLQTTNNLVFFNCIFSQAFLPCL